VPVIAEFPNNRFGNFSAMLGVILVASLLCGFAPLEELAGAVNRSGHFFRPNGEQPHTGTGGFALGSPRVEPENEFEALHGAGSFRPQSVVAARPICPLHVALLLLGAGPSGNAAIWSSPEAIR
jgi:hypothetical protein